MFVHAHIVVGNYNINYVLNDESSLPDNLMTVGEKVILYTFQVDVLVLLWSVVLSNIGILSR